MKRPLLIAALISSVIATPALAASSDFEMKVKFDRTALENPLTIDAEYDSIRDQVEARCEAEHASYRFVAKTYIINSCIEKTMNNTVRRINDDALSTLHWQAKEQ